MAIVLIDKITPKNAAFTGIVDAEQVLGDGATNVLPDNCVAETNVTQHESALSLSGLSDTDFSSLTNGEIMSYNGADWVNSPAPVASISGTGNPNLSSDPSVNNKEVGSLYTQTDSTPVSLWMKQAAGATGWRLVTAPDNEASTFLPPIYNYINIYVDPAGDDSEGNYGTDISNPLQTIARAVRVANVFENPVNVNLSAGSHTAGFIPILKDMTFTGTIGPAVETFTKDSGAEMVISKNTGTPAWTDDEWAGNVVTSDSLTYFPIVSNSAHSLVITTGTADNIFFNASTFTIHELPQVNLSSVGFYFAENQTLFKNISFNFSSGNFNQLPTLIELQLRGNFSCVNCIFDLMGSPILLQNKRSSFDRCAFFNDDANYAISATANTILKVANCGFSGFNISALNIEKTNLSLGATALVDTNTFVEASVSSKIHIDDGSLYSSNVADLFDLDKDSSLVLGSIPADHMNSTTFSGYSIQLGAGTEAMLNSGWNYDNPFRISGIDISYTDLYEKYSSRYVGNSNQKLITLAGNSPQNNVVYNSLSSSEVEILDSFADTLYRSVHWDYSAYNDSLDKYRTGTIFCIWNPDTNLINYSEQSTEIGDTSTLILSADINSDNVRLTCGITGESNWNIKLVRRVI